MALDNNYAIWKAFNNRYWPAHYFVDAQGRIRGHHFGEGDYDESERLIRSCSRRPGTPICRRCQTTWRLREWEWQADRIQDVQSPETYVGYEPCGEFRLCWRFHADDAKRYAAPGTLQLNQWALDGSVAVGRQMAVAVAPGKIVFRFQARDLHLVLGPSRRRSRFASGSRSTIRRPVRDHGTDVDRPGNGIVTEQRLYQLIRQSGDVAEHTFSIEFFEPGVQAYSFTFG